MSSSSVGPRTWDFREFWSSLTVSPWLVVSSSPGASVSGLRSAVLSVSCGGSGGLSLGATWPEVRGGSGGSVLPALAAREVCGAGWEERGDGWASRMFARGGRLTGRLLGMLVFPCARCLLAPTETRRPV